MIASFHVLSSSLASALQRQVAAQDKGRAYADQILGRDFFATDHKKDPPAYAAITATNNHITNPQHSH